MSQVIMDKMPEIVGQIHWTRAVEIHQNYLKSTKLKKTTTMTKKKRNKSSPSTYSRPNHIHTSTLPTVASSSSTHCYNTQTNADVTSTTSYNSKMMNRSPYLYNNSETEFHPPYQLSPSPSASTAITLISLGDMELKTDGKDGDNHDKLDDDDDDDDNDNTSYLNHLEAASTLSHLPRDRTNSNTNSNNALLSPCTLSSFADIQDPFTLQPYSIYHNHYRIKEEDDDEEEQEGEGNHSCSHMDVIMDSKKDDSVKKSSMSFEQDHPSTKSFSLLQYNHSTTKINTASTIDYNNKTSPTLSSLFHQSHTYLPPTFDIANNSQSKTSFTNTTTTDDSNHTTNRKGPIACIIRQTAETLLMVQKDVNSTAVSGNRNNDYNGNSMLEEG